MRRVLSATLVALLVGGLLPLPALAAIPVASPAAVTTDEDTATPILLAGTDDDGDPLIFMVATPPAHGTLTGAAPNLIYTPALNYNGPDELIFTVDDGTTTSDPAVVSITVTPVNDPPVANDDPGIACGSLSAFGGSFPIPEDWNGGSSGYEGWFALVGACGPMANDVDPDGDTLTFELVGAPEHGEATLLPDGFLAYDPGPDFSTPPGDMPGGTWVSDVISYRLFDGTAHSATASYRIWVAPVNDAPSFTPGPDVTVTEDSGDYSAAWATDIAAGPKNESNQAVSFVVDDVGDPSLFATQPEISPTGVLTFRPAANAFGLSAVEVHAKDDGGLDTWGVAGVVPVDASASKSFSIAIEGANDPPVATPQSVTTDEDTAKAITLAGTDAESSSVIYVLTGLGPAHGTLTGTAPDLTYTPAANYSGTDSFTFTVNDGAVDSLPATVSITVSPVNDPPVAIPQTVTTNEDTVKAISLTGSDVEGSVLTYSVTTNPTHGTLTGTLPDLTYTPNLNDNGSDSFTFTVNDGTVDSATSTVSITVTPVNDPPVCTAHPLATDKNQPVPGTVTCTDVDSSGLMLRVETGPGKGTVAPFDTATGAFTYMPATGVTGTDSFTVIANDGAADSLPVSVDIAIGNHAPVAEAQAVTTNEDTVKAITVAGTDVDLDTLTYTVAAYPVHGTLGGTAPLLTYTPAGNYSGTDSFTFRVSDGTAASAAATVSITVSPVNDAPVADSRAVSTSEDTAAAIIISGSDIEGSALTYGIVASPAHGTLTGTAPDLTYTPAADYWGTDSFTFTVNDGAADSATATVSISVEAVNDAPVARTDGFTVSATTTSTLAVLANDYSGPVVNGVTSEPTDTVTIVSVGTATRGRVSITPGGLSVTYDPTGCGTGGDSFTYTVTDGQGLTATTTAFVTIARPGSNGLSANPISDVPAAGLVSNSTIGSTVPLRVSWCGVTASPATVRGYTVQQSGTAGRTWPTTAILTATSASSTTRNLSVGSTYQWRTRAIDSARRTGAYRASLTARIGRYQENSAALTYSGAWSARKSTSASGGAQRWTKTAGATATITLTNVRQFAIVGPRSPGRGSFRVYVDGVLVRTVSEKATTTAYRRVLYVRSLTAGSNVSHTIQLRAVGNGQVDLDAILALS